MSDYRDLIAENARKVEQLRKTWYTDNIMLKYTKENYFVNNVIPQDVLSKLQARKDELHAEVCEIEALICEHNANVLRQQALEAKRRHA
jgi:hypothetical protein